MQAELENLAWKHNAPLTAFLELTHSCNFGCGHCYNFDRSKSQPKAHRPPLRLSDFKVILEQLKDLGVMQVCLTGGEPLVYRDLLPLCQFGSNLGLFLSLKTNGSRLSFEKLQELVAAGVKGIDITLYGLSEQTQDSFVGVKNAWSNVTQAIKDIQKLPFELTINWSILRHNEHEETMLSARSEEFGQRINPIRGCKPRHDGSEDSTSHRAESNLEQFTKAEEAYRLKLLEESPHDHQFQCACAKTSLAISHTGIVWPCTSVPWEAGDILNTSLRENLGIFSRPRRDSQPDTPKTMTYVRSAHWSRRAPEETERPMWKAVHTRELTNMPGS